MRRWILVLVALVILAVPALGAAQTVITVDPAMNRFEWTQPAPKADGTDMPDSFRFQCGTVSKGGIPYVSGQTTFQAMINSIVATPGTYDCNVRAVNEAGESGPSNTVTILIQQLYQIVAMKVGQGTVVSSPSGIDCGAVCNASFVDASTVTLTATPAAGWRFKGWTGDCTGTSTTCTVTVNAAKAVTARFLGVPANPTGLTIK
jgi:uncharacterized repeat protein (TIGR02543 family)